MSKLASLIVILGGSLLFVQAASAQGDPGYSSGPQPVYAAPGGATVGPRSAGGGIRDNGPHARPMTASALLSTPWRYGFGIGVTGAFEIPIVHDGFIPSINNSFSIEPFLTIAWNNYGLGSAGCGLVGCDDNPHAWEYTPGVAGLWSFYFSPRLRAYAAVRAGVTVLAVRHDAGFERFDKTTPYFFGELAPGIVWNVTDNIALRADIGWWSGLKGGVSFLL
ncbi:MAG: hypothetical protein RLZZ450_6815 [Pseudomonadota bacterium]